MAEDETERGLRFAHIMMMVGQSQGNQSLAAIMALADVLVAKGVISEEEFDQAKARAQEHVEQMAQPRVRLATMGDKYKDEQTAEIDCHNRIHLCHARCCTFNFYLTAQDLDEGVARWDYGNPYWIKRGEDGYCVHCDPGSRACAIHAHRPHVCRLYDCRQDKRIWIDFEARIPAPMETPSGPLPIALAELDLARDVMTGPVADESDAKS
ncbi:MAG TPA: YkgJ family cysteine cluster protein [Thermomicrobiales bacterium]|nr:YkgJ family cysteine cluster protein [Thermomicrobiales bacterium]